MQHALFVVDDDLGRTEVEQPLESVVAVDDPAVEVVQIGGGESAAVQLHHGAQFRGDDRDGVQDHGPGIVDAPAVLVAPVERRHDLQPLDGLLLPLLGELLLALGRIELLAELALLLVQVDAVDKRGDDRGTHASGEQFAIAVFHLPPQLLVLDDFAGEQA